MFDHVRQGSHRQLQSLNKIKGGTHTNHRNIPFAGMTRSIIQLSGYLRPTPIRRFLATGTTFLGTLFLLIGTATGGSMRCQGRLVSVGAFPNEVSSICGEPTDIRTLKLHPKSRISNHYDYEYERYRAPYLIKGPLIKEVWTYDFGTNRLLYTLHFENDRLIRIETGNRRP